MVNNCTEFATNGSLYPAMARSAKWGDSSGFAGWPDPGYAARCALYSLQLLPIIHISPTKLMLIRYILLVCVAAIPAIATAQPPRDSFPPRDPKLQQFKQQGQSGNPVFPGWYADPEGIVFGDRYWIFPTYSAPYHEQTHFDCFSSPDLVQWTKHPRVLTAESVSWAKYAMWAPSIIEHRGQYYFFFAANDIQNNESTGGIGVAVADRPEGPYRDALGKPLIDKFHNGAQPIDQFVFRDDDGQHYMYYGGWRHCNVTRLADDLLSLVPLDDGQLFKEITPERYVEGPFVFKRDGRYYMMWSEGGWTGPNYSVAYAVADSPLGPFVRKAKILQQDPQVATGAGHHSVIHPPGTSDYYIVYHRRPLGETDGNHRVVCIDRLTFDDQGNIEPVKITFEGVKAHPLGQQTTAGD
jgi:beta-xylosidase